MQAYIHICYGASIGDSWLACHLSPTAGSSTAEADLTPCSEVIVETTATTSTKTTTTADSTTADSTTGGLLTWDCRDLPKLKSR